MSSTDSTSRWLILVHQLPAQPSKLRVKVWRRLQAVGAVLVKNSVYVLPNNDESRENFEWIRGEILSDGGEAVVFTADAIDDLSADEVVNAFVTARRDDWRALEEKAAALREQLESGPSGQTRAEAIQREVTSLRNRATQVDKIDFFQAPGRDRAVAAIDALTGEQRREAERAQPAGPTLQRDEYQGRAWVTRPRPGVDRMASAWLIRRFIDPAATFSFSDRVPTDNDSIPFDMYGVEFGHQGSLCTFETLIHRFGIDEAGLTRLASIVHALDLHTTAESDPETATVGRLVDGLREARGDDVRLLESGIEVFEALYRSFRAETASA